jgi:hypothetical protein
LKKKKEIKRHLKILKFKILIKMLPKIKINKKKKSKRKIKIRKKNELKFKL